MSERRIFLFSLSAIILLILLLSLFSFAVSNIKFTSNKLYSNQSGRVYNSVLINNFDFDSIILGSSMSQGSKCSVFDSAFGGKSMKLACSAINFAEIEFFVDRAAGKKRIRRVIFDAPVMFFSRRQSTEDIPAEYYQDNIKFVLYKKSFSINALTESLSEAKNLIRKKTRHVSRDELYDWNIGRKCGEKYFAQALLYGEETQFGFGEELFRKSKTALEQHLIPMFERHPDTEFILFFPPFSMMYYRSFDHRAYIKLKGEIAERLLAVKNVKLYDFETAFHIMEDFENYRDTNHYSGRINSWMMQQMAQGNYLLNKENKQQSLDKLRKRFETYDFAGEYGRIKTKYAGKRK